MRTTATLILLFTNPALCPAQSISVDASAQIADMLNKLGPKPVDHERMVPNPNPNCRIDRITSFESCTNITMRQVYAVDEILKTSGLTALALSPIEFDKPDITQFPDSYVSSGYAVYNCSNSLTPTFQLTTSVSFARSSGISITHTIGHTGSASAGFQWKIADDITITGGVQVTDTATTATTNSGLYTQTVQRTSSETINNLKPRTAAIATTSTYPTKYVATFHAKAVVEASLSNGKKLSDYFSAVDRSLPVSGKIEFADAADGQAIVDDLPFDASKCSSRSNGLVQVPVQKSGKKDYRD